jgi:DNA-binding NarL/FixJ family response regulator
MKRLMIVADNSFAAQSIRLALRQTTGFQIIGFVEGETPLTARICALGPDLVLVDDMQEPESAYARLRELAKEVPQAKRIVLTLRMDDEAQTAFHDAGAEVIISKMVHPLSLATVLREVARGNIVQFAPRPIEQPRVECDLTEAELKVLALVATGLSNGQVAAQLYVTEQTVKFHLSSVYATLGVANRTEASRYYWQHDLAHAAPRPYRQPRARRSRTPLAA